MTRTLSERKRAIAYSVDTLIPGFYVWLGFATLRIGGAAPDDSPYRYPGKLNSFCGLAIVWPWHQILTTYHRSHD